VLLVEDDPAHAHLVKRSLEAHDFDCHVVHVNNGEVALEYLLGKNEYADRRRYPRPQLLLLDLRLPRVDGLEVLRQIRAQADLALLPIVVLTTSRADLDISRAYGHHVNSYLVKPLEFDHFKRLMRDLGEYWLRWNQAAPPWVAS
jgi:CheY-like chemotaxis protein